MALADGTSATDDFIEGLAGLLDTATTVTTWGEYGTHFAADEAAALDAADKGLTPDEASQLQAQYEYAEDSSDILGDAAGATIDQAPADAVDAAGNAVTNVATRAGKAVGGALGAAAPGLGAAGKALLWVLLPIAVIAGLVLVVYLSGADVVKGKGKGKKK